MDRKNKKKIFVIRTSYHIYQKIILNNTVVYSIL